MINTRLQKGTFYSWVVVLASALFFFYIFIQMNLFNAINSELVKEFHFNASQISQLFAFFSYGNVLFLFPAGILLDRFSVRRLQLTVFGVSIIAIYLFSTASNFWAIGLSRFVLGIAGSFTLLSSVKLASRWFDPKRMALVVGVVVTMALLGGMLAQTPLALLIQKVGWRYALQIIVLLGLGLMVVQYLFVFDMPKHLKRAEVRNDQPKQIGFWRSLSLVITSKQNWLSGVYVACGMGKHPRL